jgi:hypothetical protein
MTKTDRTNGRLIELVEELDQYCKDNDVTDWELDFISDMMGQKSFYGKQPDNILRMWEKYCA